MSHVPTPWNGQDRFTDISIRLPMMVRVTIIVTNWIQHIVCASIQI